MEMDDQDRVSATISAFQKFDPEGKGGVYLRDVAEHVGEMDDKFMRRYNLVSKVIGAFGFKRREGDIGFSYLPRIYVVAAKLEREGIIDSDWDEYPEGDVTKPRRRLYRYLGSRSVENS